jgi:hypothetical protein
MNRLRSARRWCTYFDSNYLARGMVMLRSLLRHNPTARIDILALDDLCARVVRERFGASVRVIVQETLHGFAPRLREIQGRRSPWEYYATQKPALAMFALESSPRPESVLFIDADTSFFSDPSPIFDELGTASIGLSPHRFSPALQGFDVYGKYNAGCVYWRNDETGRRCLADWLDDCLEWCSEQAEPDGRFMNQGYLNRWPERYPSVHLLQHPGVNLAPWNIDGHRLEHDGERLLVDGLPLIFYHFHAVSRDAHGEWHSRFPHLERQSDLALEAIYHPHLAAVEAERRGLLEEYAVEGTGSLRSMDSWPARIRLTGGPPSSRPSSQ